MDTFLAIASKRDRRRYAEQPVPPEVERRILDAGRLAGSGSNRQPWTLVVVESRDRVEALAEAVYAPGNVQGAALVVGILVTGKGPIAFDAGRAAQNMVLAAWNDGVVSCPNGIADEEGARAALEAGREEQVAIVLSFGYPQEARDPERRSAEEWSAAANRKQLEEVVRRV